MTRKKHTSLARRLCIGDDLLKGQVEIKRLRKVKKTPNIPSVEGMYENYRNSYNAAALKLGLPQIKASYTTYEFLVGAKSEQEFREAFYIQLIVRIWPDAEFGFQELNRRIRAGKKGAAKRHGGDQSKNIVRCAKSLLADGEPRRGLGARVRDVLSTSLSVRHINRILEKAGI